MSKRFIAAVDLGGTKIAAGIVGTDGTLVGTPVRVATNADKPTEIVINTIAGAALEAMRGVGVDPREMLGVGIGSPGPLDAVNGVIRTPRNLPSLHGVNLKRELESRLQAPVWINNDANVFALGEAVFGAGKDSRIVFGITLGTGFGSGLVIDKRIFNGATTTAAEIWCFPYKDSIIEDYVSGRGLERTYERCSIGVHADPKTIAERARSGETAALEAWRSFGVDAGIALSYVINVVDPDIVVVGGSLANAFDLFAPHMDTALRSHINPAPREHVRLVRAMLGDCAPLLGAAALVLEHEPSR